MKRNYQLIIKESGYYLGNINIEEDRLINCATSIIYEIGNCKSHFSILKIDTENKIIFAKEMCGLC